MKITWSVIYLTRQGFEAFVTIEEEADSQAEEVEIVDRVLRKAEQVLARMKGRVQPVRSGPAWPVGRTVQALGKPRP